MTGLNYVVYAATVTNHYITDQLNQLWDLTQSLHMKSNKTCVLRRNYHIDFISLYDLFPWCGSWIQCYHSTLEHANTVKFILFLYVCIQHWSSCFRNKNYMLICDMSFSVSLSWYSITPKYICSNLSVTLYWLTISLLHKCFLLMMPGIMTCNGTDWWKWQGL